jgi:preprotein translocase subunit SecF
MLHIIRPGTQIDFVGKRHLWLGLSVVFILATVVLMVTKGLNYGVDFTGGAEVQITVAKEWDTAKVRDALEKSGLQGPRIQQAGDTTGPTHDYLVRVQATEAELNQVGERVKKAFEGAPSFSVGKVDVVGPAAGSLLRQKGFLSMFYALLVILVYVAIRFDSRFAPGAVIALFHDTVFTIGVFAVTQMQFDLTILAALLVLIGYSNNDTIIVYDRVRETMALHPSMKIEEVVNRAINDTLGRTLVTSITTILSALALYLFGGDVIRNFAFTFIIGIVVGTYSSIFIASSVVIWITQVQKKKKVAAATGGGKPTRAGAQV